MNDLVLNDIAISEMGPYRNPLSVYIGDEIALIDKEDAKKIVEHLVREFNLEGK